MFSSPRKAQRRRYTAFALAPVLAVSFVACDESGAGDDSEVLKVGLAIAGPRNDDAFNEAHVQGIDDAEESGIDIELSVLDNLEDPQAQIDAITNLARANDVVVAGGAEFAQGLDALADQYPETHFILTSGVTEKFHENVSSEAVNWGLAAYVSGVVAATTSKSRTIAIIGGSEIPPTVQAGIGFEAGAAEAAPDVNVRETVVGSYNDAAKAKEAANALIADNVDTIFSFLDAGTQGVFQAAEEAGDPVSAVSVIFPQCDASPRAAGTAIYDFRVLTANSVKDFAAGELEPGARFYGLEDPRVMRFELCPAFEDSEVAALIEETTRAVVDGTAPVPAEASYPEPSYANAE